MKYGIINYITNKVISCYDDIELGFTLDRVLDELDRYELEYKLYKYNFSKIIVIK